MKDKTFKKLVMATAFVAASLTATSAFALGGCRTYIGTGGYYVVYNSDGVATSSGWDPAGYMASMNQC